VPGSSITPVKGNTARTSGRAICGTVIAIGHASIWFRYRAMPLAGQDNRDPSHDDHNLLHSTHAVF
jgi:hypothetical protein